MFWYDHLYLGKKCRRRANRLLYKIANGIPHPTVYLLMLPQGEGAVLEIVPSTLLLQAAYPKEDLHIIGMGADRREAAELAGEIVGEVYRTQGNFDVAAYMKIIE